MRSTHETFCDGIFDTRLTRRTAHSRNDVVFHALFFMKVFNNIRIVRGNDSESRAFFFFLAVAAGRKTFLHSAFSDSADTFAENSLYSVCAASVAVDMFRQNGRVVQFAPEFRRFFTQSVIVVFCCDVCVALFAV